MSPIHILLKTWRHTSRHALALLLKGRRRLEVCLRLPLPQYFGCQQVEVSLLLHTNGPFLDKSVQFPEGGNDKLGDLALERHP